MIYVVILAGGSGTRFWPLSRPEKPKQFLCIGGERTLLESTVERVLPLCGWERLLVVASAEHGRPIRRLLPELPSQNLLLEPHPRNTAPAIGWAALEIGWRDPGASIVVVPSDHIIRPAAAFRRLIRAAVRSAAGGALVTLGVFPSRPETGYGYIRTGRVLQKLGGIPVYEVLGFTEKPDRPAAMAYLSQGGHYWNSGIFVFTARALLRALPIHMPALHAGLAQLHAVRNRSLALRRRALEGVFRRLPSESIDYGLMEKAAEIRMLPCELAWSDVGSWAALPEVSPQDENGNTARGQVLLLDSRGCVVQASSRTVACLGLRDMVVVETPDAVLVCPLSEAQGVRRVADELARRAKGRRGRKR